MYPFYNCETKLHDFNINLSVTNKVLGVYVRSLPIGWHQIAVLCKTLAANCTVCKHMGGMSFLSSKLGRLYCRFIMCFFHIQNKRD